MAGYLKEPVVLQWDMKTGSYAVQFCHGVNSLQGGHDYDQISRNHPSYWIGRLST